MQLNLKGLSDKASWSKAEVALPRFDVEKVHSNTKNNPIWLHFGAGNIFRGYIARLQQTLLNAGLSESGIIAADTFDYDIIDKIYKPYDSMTMLVGLSEDGSTKKEIIASIAEGIKADVADLAEWQKLEDIFTSKTLQMVSFTITEKGYMLSDVSGRLLPLVEDDIKNGPNNPKHAMSIIASLMLKRFNAGALKIALVSMDNCSHNGERLKKSVCTIAEKWYNNGFVDLDFINYLNDEKSVSFPWSMIDKITPRPADVIFNQLKNLGIEHMNPIVTSKNTYIAPYVNAEIPQYLVIEDDFPNGRPPLSEAGVFFTDREIVNMTERMKVTTCLNPLHTALAIYGCLLGYDSISAEMKDAQLSELVRRIGYNEGMPVVVDPKIINPQNFLKEVLEKRFPNAYIPDTPQRIATDTSQKLAIRFGETIKAYANKKDLNPADLVYIPLVLAGWLRYLLGVDDCGNPMEISSDPMLEKLQGQLSGIKFGEVKNHDEGLEKILSSSVIFGVNLYDVGLADKVEGYFWELNSSIGAVRGTLKKYLI